MKNVELRALAYLVSKEPETYKDGGDGVTLAVNGLLISGLIIPKSAYLDQKQNKTLKSFYDLADKAKAEQGGDEDPEEKLDLEKYTRLYLKNARYFVGDRSFPTNGENYAIIDIDSVNAYNMGALGPEPQD